MNEFPLSKGLFFPPFQPNLEIDTEYYVEHRTGSSLHQTSFLFYFVASQKILMPLFMEVFIMNSQ
ncbi:hypothetical protein SAMN04488123_10580 [Natribacillus halophilus]|uniref:Uncharacterized protein n=1 Tax=Natribacillus halophilus TaxID=549003 RepID=A0A1G8MX41_9BACI|nr:hypothetical protein SAMN04488123_10580 [Natribacillus halophilus]